MSHTPLYHGRFAPSPTGPLHFGSMVAAVGSFLQARRQGGLWRVRIEDLDPPREVPGAADDILRTLENVGLQWDGAVCYQSRRSDAYTEALERLSRQGLLYPCSCSRAQIMQSAEVSRYGPIYRGLCRPGPGDPQRPPALRVLTHDRLIRFDDALRGRVEQRLESEVGDFVLRRADRLFAYQLAVVVDDAEQGITEVVRGADLLDNTPRQIHLQQLLSLPTPGYVHLPVALTRAGQKLSKQSGATGIQGLRPQLLLYHVLQFLQQQPPRELLEVRLDELWDWAVAHWRLAQVPREDRPAPLLQP